ncbi:hypothetical protein NQ315_006060 [Exocentrus adspersus]|uniref:Uncharacterized protein n=1 Tax=Exocentrus adspersus TaxID=1586481 RepID=A0AAV8VFW4_9CUCU|nr:hypothetical protein NQ315_006060 [Exocentrus adspersus]
MVYFMTELSNILQKILQSGVAKFCKAIIKFLNAFPFLLPPGLKTECFSYFQWCRIVKFIHQINYILLRTPVLLNNSPIIRLSNIHEQCQD